jgi:hypothetical protein
MHTTNIGRLNRFVKAEVQKKSSSPRYINPVKDRADPARYLKSLAFSGARN